MFIFSRILPVEAITTKASSPNTRAKDLLAVNKTDLAEMVRAGLGVMDRDAKKMRGEEPTVFACIKDREGLEAIVEHILKARGRRCWQKLLKTGEHDERAMISGVLTGCRGQSVNAM